MHPYAGLTQVSTPNANTIVRIYITLHILDIPTLQTTQRPTSLEVDVDGGAADGDQTYGKR